MKRRPMSEILKEIALTILLRPEAVPSSEAAGAALLLSHVAWNRANGEEFTDHMYRGVIEEMENSRPDFGDKRTVRRIIFDHFDYIVTEWNKFQEGKNG